MSISPVPSICHSLPGNDEFSAVNNLEMSETKGDNQEEPYSLLTKFEKYNLSFLLGISAIWSTLSSSIYFPAIPVIAKSYSVSTSLANLTVVAYLLFQGIAPTILAPLADSYGRRPFVLASLLIYCSICIGISQTNIYWLLVFLRCLQAISIAPIISISNGVVADICNREERGTYVGFLTGMLLLGQGFGALIGAAVMVQFSWRGIFVLLAIGSGVVFLLDLILFPETNRQLVGNLSYFPRLTMNKLPIIYTKVFTKRMKINRSERPGQTKPTYALAPFTVLLNFEIFCFLLAGGMQFMVWTMALASLSTILEKSYHYSMIEIGLCYLSPGFATLLGSLVSGIIIDWNYKRHLKLVENYNHINDGNQIMISLPKARLEITIIPTIVLLCCFIVFGWCFQEKVSIAPILVAAFIFSFCTIFFMSALTTLLVDLYPKQSSSLTSCINLMRCLLAALGVGVMQNIIDAIGVGGCYTLMSGICGVSVALIYFIQFVYRK